MTGTGRRRVLCLNGGSSSVKAAVVVGRADQGPAELERSLSLAVDGIGTGHARLVVAGGPTRTLDAPDHRTAVAAVLDHVGSLPGPAVDAVGHRLVHGGPDLRAPVVLTGAVRRALEAVVAFAPLHLPAELATVDLVAERWPDLVQVGCFDTGFHATLPPAARRLPVPGWLDEAGEVRYGFHGLSYEWLVATVPEAAHGRAVLAHLGNGASLAAVADGRSVDTTMGLTPTGGLVMGTRTGDLDPGVVVHVLRATDLGIDGVARLIDHEAGLAGLSGGTADVRDLLAAEADDPDAALALEVFCRQAAKHVAAMSASLGGLDALVLTGGIGEHAAPVRARIAARLGHLGVVVDDRANEAGARRISPDGSPVTVLVVPTDEEAVLAHHVLTLTA